MNISHQNAGPDPPQLYGSSWEHGSWGRNKAKRGQVRLAWFSGPPISQLHDKSSAQQEQPRPGDACPDSACLATSSMPSHHCTTKHSTARCRLV